MMIFADTSNVEEIRELWDGGLIHGVTTNPSIIAKQHPGGNWHKVIAEICTFVRGPVSAEVVSETSEDMVYEGKELSEIDENVVVKLPCTPAGIKACKVLTEYMNIKVNMTLCFSVAQAVLASNVGAFLVSPFVGRVDDVSGTGIKLIQDIQNAYINDIKLSRTPKILAASIRSVEHLNLVAQYADAATCPPKVIWKIFDHKLTVDGLKQFQDDWKKANE